MTLPIRWSVSLRLLQNHARVFHWYQKPIALWSWYMLRDSSLQVWRVRLNGYRAYRHGVVRCRNPYRLIYAPFDVPAWFQGYDFGKPTRITE